MSDQPDAETSTWQHTTLTRDRHPCPPARFEPNFGKWAPAAPCLDRAAAGISGELPYSKTRYATVLMLRVWINRAQVLPSTTFPI